MAQPSTGKQNIRVFLGGTCNGSQWRSQIIPRLTIDYFDPVVADWNEAAQQQELQERQTADFVLYVITPLMTGVYAIAEVVDDSNKRPDKTILVVLTTDGTPERGDVSFSQAQLNSLQAVGRMVAGNGGRVFYTLESAANYLNEQIEG